MKKRYKHAPQGIMRRSARVFLDELNIGKGRALTDFLYRCHDAMQYFVDLFWQRRDFSADLADLETVHRGRDRFNLTSRLAQALAKQAKECVRVCPTFYTWRFLLGCAAHDTNREPRTACCNARPAF